MLSSLSKMYAYMPVEQRSSHTRQKAGFFTEDYHIESFQKDSDDFHKSWHRLRRLVVGMLLSFEIVAALSYLFFYPQLIWHDRGSNCGRLHSRRGWRTLSQQEQTDYISAVQCLRGKPSRLGLSHSLYDDFPFVHRQVGHRS